MPGQDLKDGIKNKVGIVGVPFSKGQVRCLFLLIIIYLFLLNRN